jgi:two-component sensor histidine kinase
MKSGSRTGAIVLCREITELRRQEQELLTKDATIREIHHRVKNNLQVISGLLELQKEDVSDEIVKAALSEGQNRVRSVALIHHNLYQHESLSSLSFKSFLPELVKNISDVYSSKKQTIEVEILGNDIILDIDTVVSLGLILNELITNAYKYAISAEKKPKVTFQIAEQTVGNFSMIYQDNGPGIPKGIDFENSSSLGLRLIKGLIEQLSGTVKYNYNNGAEFIFYFKNAQARKDE